MGKFIVRATIVITALYLAMSYLIAQFAYVDILYSWYSILFELCVVVYSFSEGKYHCKCIKYTALSILVADVITRLDNSLDFLSVDMHNIIPIGIISAGVTVGVILSIKHYIHVLKIKSARLNGIVRD